jgi:FkbM family methyltransferase
MKSIIRTFAPKTLLHALRLVRQRWFTNYARDSFSQEGEDLIIERFFEHKMTGFYVDIGAHHPMRFSNTYRLYRRGWRGVNVDANPGSMLMFSRLRPRDINVEVGVSAARGDLTFYVFNDPALNTFDEQLALHRVSGNYSIVKEVIVPTRPLGELLDQYVPNNTAIDFLTIDVEGLDYEVLRSNDWSRYTPEYVLVESLQTLTLEQVSADQVGKFLLDQQYSIVAKTMNSVLFQRNVGERKLVPPN